jgi:ABC-type branched-subunit amino acid transport system ATPase component
LVDIPGPVIRTQGLSKTYDGIEALKSLALEVPAKSIFAFLGPNGAGKTTTIKLLLGLTRPTAGGATISQSFLHPPPNRLPPAGGGAQHRYLTVLAGGFASPGGGRGAALP